MERCTKKKGRVQTIAASERQPSLCEVPQYIALGRIKKAVSVSKGSENNQYIQTIPQTKHTLHTGNREIEAW